MLRLAAYICILFAAASIGVDADENAISLTVRKIPQPLSSCQCRNYALVGHGDSDVIPPTVDGTIDPPHDVSPFPWTFIKPCLAKIGADSLNCMCAYARLSCQ